MGDHAARCSRYANGAVRLHSVVRAMAGHVRRMRGGPASGGTPVARQSLACTELQLFSGFAVRFMSTPFFHIINLMPEVESSDTRVAKNRCTRSPVFFLFARFPAALPSSDACISRQLHRAPARAGSGACRRVACSRCRVSALRAGVHGTRLCPSDAGLGVCRTHIRSALSLASKICIDAAVTVFRRRRPRAQAVESCSLAHISSDQGRAAGAYHLRQNAQSLTSRFWRVVRCVVAFLR